MWGRPVSSAALLALLVFAFRGIGAAQTRLQGTYYNQPIVAYQPYKKKSKHGVSREDRLKEQYLFTDINNLYLNISSRKEDIVRRTDTDGKEIDPEFAKKNVLKFSSEIGFSVIYPAFDPAAQTTRDMAQDLFSIERLNVELLYDFWSLRAGRSLPFWGGKSSNFFRVLDIFTEHTFLNTQVTRKGVDGLFPKIYFFSTDKASLSLEAVVLPKYQLAHSRFGFNLEFSLDKLELLLIDYQNQETQLNTLGLGVKYDLILGALVLPTLLGSCTFDFRRTEDVFFYDRKFRFSVGFDYSIENMFFFTFEYYYNEYGSNDMKAYDWSMELINGNFLYARYYYYASLGVKPIEDIRFDLSLLYNRTDHSFVLFPGYTHTIFSSTDLNFSFYWFYPDDGNYEFAPDRTAYFMLSAYLMVRF